MATEVYKAPRRFTKLRELARTYEMLTDDVVRAKNRLRSAYRRRAVHYPGHDLAAQAEGLVELPSWMRQSIEATPHRFRTKRQFWAYCGFGVVTRTSSDWIQVRKQWVRAPVQQTHGLDRDCNRTLKRIFKGAAMTAICCKKEPLWTDYQRLTANGTRPNLARLTVARKLAAAMLVMWKKKERYNPKS